MLQTKRGKHKHRTHQGRPRPCPRSSNQCRGQSSCHRKRPSSQRIKLSRSSGRERSCMQLRVHPRTALLNSACSQSRFLRRSHNQLLPQLCASKYHP